jgi:5-hydroxyisourate hydrolase
VTISTHILDTSAGRPAAGVAVRLEHHDGMRWLPVGDGVTSADGRVPSFVSAGVSLPPGKYRLIFEIGAYFASRQTDTFYPRAVVEFLAPDAGPSTGLGAGHLHVPLLVSPFGYTTYRGS